MVGLETTYEVDAAIYGVLDIVGLVDKNGEEVVGTYAVVYG